MRVGNIYSTALTFLLLKTAETIGMTQKIELEIIPVIRKFGSGKKERIKSSVPKIQGISKKFEITPLKVVALMKERNKTSFPILYINIDRKINPVRVTNI